MKIQNEIEVAAPADELFDVLADVKRVAPLLPGATLEGKENDDSYAGTVKLKIGPITASYRGTLRFRELDHENYRAVMEASAQETQGQGSTEATITASVFGSNSESVLNLDTDLEVRGKAAQFGGGALSNVSQHILDQFARNLEAEVLSTKEKGEEPPPSEEAVSTEGAETDEKSAPTKGAEDDEAASAKSTFAALANKESLDVLSVVGMPMLRQAAPAVAGLALGFLIGNFMASRETLRAYQEIVRLMGDNSVYGPPTKGWRQPRY